MRQLKLKVTVLRICDINLEKYTFEADIMIQATWREPSLNELLPEMLVKMNLDDHWNPNLKVSNALLFYLTKVSSALFFKSRKQAMARLLMRVRALFPIHFSAATFPFEEVTLPIFITTERQLNEVTFMRDGGSNVIVPEVLEDQRKWTLKSTVNVVVFNTDILPHLGLNNLSLEYIGTRHPVFSYQCKIRRNVTFFFLSTFIWQTLMTYVAFSSFCINSRLLHFRLMHSILVLFLTTSIRSLTFASFFNRSAITYEEMYFLMTWMMQFCLCLWHVFSAVALSLSVYMERVDHAAHIALELLYLTEISMFYYLVKGQSVSWIDRLSSPKLTTGIMDHRKLKSI